MDYENVIADREEILPCSYTAGRYGSIQGITIHHMAGDLSIDTCYDIWANGETSAHYAIESDGTVGQLVNDWDTAWACGNWWANSNTISIEHANNGSDPWTVYPAAIESGAHLVAALCKMYDLGRPEWCVNVFPHQYWSATACPGELAGSQNAEYMNRAQYWYDVMTGARAEEQPAPAAPAAPAASWPIQLYTPNATVAQKWIVEHEGEFVRFRAVCNDMYLDVQNGEARNQVPVWVYVKNGSDAQKFKLKTFETNDDKSFEIHFSVDDNMVVDCMNGGQIDGTGIQLFESNGTSAQRWSFVNAGRGAVYIINEVSGKALDVVGGGK